MANEIRTKSNPFIESAKRIQQSGGVKPASTRTRNTPKAILNLIPDADKLSGMIDGALQALSRGVRWARGSILNLLV